MKANSESWFFESWLNEELERAQEYYPDDDSMRDGYIAGLRAAQEAFQEENEQ